MTTLALIGYGRWGKNYTTTARNLTNVRIKYICTSKTNELEKDYVQVHDYKDLLQFNDIDGIIVATPAATHFSIAKYFLEKDYNLLIEKPFTTSYDDAVALQKISNTHKSIVMIGHIYLYNPAFIKVTELVHELGEIQYMDLEGSNWGPFRDDTSALWDWGPHDISMCLQILGEPNAVQVSSVTGVNRSVDMAYCVLRFPSNSNAFIKIGCLSPVKTRKVVLVGTKKSIIFDDTKDKKIELFEKKGSNMKGNSLSEASFVSYPIYGNESPLSQELDAFVTAIHAKKNPFSDVAFAVKIAKIMDALECSFNTNASLIKL